MKRFLLALAAMFMLASAPAHAEKIFSHSYGSWELMAWDNNNQFCALKTYIGDKTLAIRLNSTDGLVVVVTDPQFSFRIGEAPARISFNNRYYSTYTEYTPYDATTQVFINIGFDDDFLEKVMASHVLSVESEDVSYNLNLIGTRYLGSHLVDCVRNFGF